VKDLSVENPNAPEAFQWTDQAQMDIQFNIAARIIQPEVHEVELKITLTASMRRARLYRRPDLCGLIGMRGLDDAQMHAFVFAEAPRLMFPFARRVLADAVRDAGLPLLLEPVDFGGCISSRCSAGRRSAGPSPPMSPPATPDSARPFDAKGPGVPPLCLWGYKTALHEPS
jgi:preprotein translocase subunit SecB